MGTRLADKTAIVTGAGSGIGRAIALRFAAEGARVLAVDISGAEEQTSCESDGIEPFHCDISSVEDVSALENEVHTRFGGLDVLANNAGRGDHLVPLHEYPIESFDAVHAVNVRGSFLVLQAAIRLMLESGGGSVVNTASIVGFRAEPGAAAYVTSKGAIVMMTRQAGLEYAARGIRVNAVCPGAIETPAMLGAGAEVISAQEAKVPQGRLGQPEEVAALVLFLASDEASHVTGQCFVIDGGRLTA